MVLMCVDDEWRKGQIGWWMEECARVCICMRDVCICMCVWLGDVYHEWCGERVVATDSGGERGVARHDGGNCETRCSGEVSCQGGGGGGEG